MNAPAHGEVQCRSAHRGTARFRAAAHLALLHLLSLGLIVSLDVPLALALALAHIHVIVRIIVRSLQTENPKLPN